MKYSRVYLDSMGYELPPVVVTSDELEQRIAPVYEDLHMQQGQLKALTGINERRWWEPGYPLSQGAAAAARRALEQSNVTADDIEILIYAGVCRENFEPATACAVANALDIRDDTFIFDISNACLGMLNGIIDVANRIELKQIKAGIVVSCESAREINELTIARLLEDRSMDNFTQSIATLTGGSGAAAVVLTDGSFSKPQIRKLVGAATKAAPEHHELCRWGLTLHPLKLTKLMFSPEKLKMTVEELMKPDTLPAALKDMMTSDRVPTVVQKMLPSESLPRVLTQVMQTDSVAVLKHGVDLGLRTWSSFLSKLGWGDDQVDKVICHQVGDAHRDTILGKLGIPKEKEFATYSYLGNMGTVSLPMSAALAEQRGFLNQGERVGFLGIGSGLNCLMLGWEW
jgi:acyl-CoA:acyl-CoA alkyltransferase